MSNESQKISKRKWFKKKYSEDMDFRKKHNEYCKDYQKTHRKEIYATQLCKILKKHHVELKEDPEHLTTDFLQKLIINKYHTS